MSAPPKIVPVRKHAFAALVKAIEDAVPVLKGKVLVEASRSTDMVWPSLGIRCVRAPFKRFQRRKVARERGATIFDCGHFEALVQLRLGAGTEAQRRDLGEQVVGAFLGDGESAGTLVTPMPAIPSDIAGEPGVACWDLDEEGWGDEMAFTDKWWSICTVTGRFPALVSVEGPLIESIGIEVDDGVDDETVFATEDEDPPLLTTDPTDPSP